MNRWRGRRKGPGAQVRWSGVVKGGDSWVWWDHRHVAQVGTGERSGKPRGTLERGKSEEPGEPCTKGSPRTAGLDEVHELQEDLLSFRVRILL